MTKEIKKAMMLDMKQETVDFMIASNKDLVQSEIDEQYEQCSLIATSINLWLNNQANVLAEFNSGMTRNEIFKILKENSDFVYESMKEKENE